MYIASFYLKMYKLNVGLCFALSDWMLWSIFVFTYWVAKYLEVLCQLSGFVTCRGKMDLKPIEKLFWPYICKNSCKDLWLTQSFCVNSLCCNKVCHFTIAGLLKSFLKGLGIVATANFNFSYLFLKIFIAI